MEPNLDPPNPIAVVNIADSIKSEGIVDEFLRECLAHVDTKSSFQNLGQRVAGFTANFLANEKWTPDTDKSDVRAKLRKLIDESGMLYGDTDNFIEEVIKPQINHILLPKVTKIVHRYLDNEKLNSKQETVNAEKISTETLTETNSTVIEKKEVSHLSIKNRSVELPKEVKVSTLQTKSFDDNKETEKKKELLHPSKACDAEKISTETLTETISTVIEKKEVSHLSIKNRSVELPKEVKVSTLQTKSFDDNKETEKKKELLHPSKACDAEKISTETLTETISTVIEKKEVSHLSIKNRSVELPKEVKVSTLQTKSFDDNKETEKKKELLHPSKACDAEKISTETLTETISTVIEKEEVSHLSIKNRTVELPKEVEVSTLQTKSFDDNKETEKKKELLHPSKACDAEKISTETLTETISTVIEKEEVSHLSIKNRTVELPKEVEVSTLQTKSLEDKELGKVVKMVKVAACETGLQIPQKVVKENVKHEKKKVDILKLQIPKKLLQSEENSENKSSQTVKSNSSSKSKLELPKHKKKKPLGLGVTRTPSKVVESHKSNVRESLDSSSDKISMDQSKVSAKLPNVPSKECSSPMKNTISPIMVMCEKGGDSMSMNKSKFTSTKSSCKPESLKVGSLRKKYSSFKFKHSSDMYEKEISITISNSKPDDKIQSESSLTSDKGSKHHYPSSCDLSKGSDPGRAFSSVTSKEKVTYFNKHQREDTYSAVSIDKPSSEQKWFSEIQEIFLFSSSSSDFDGFNSPFEKSPRSEMFSPDSSVSSVHSSQLSSFDDEVSDVEKDKSGSSKKLTLKEAKEKLNAMYEKQRLVALKESSDDLADPASCHFSPTTLMNAQHGRSSSDGRFSKKTAMNSIRCAKRGRPSSSGSHFSKKTAMNSKRGRPSSSGSHFSKKTAMNSKRGRPSSSVKVKYSNRSKQIIVKVPDPLCVGKYIRVKGDAGKIRFLRDADLNPVVDLGIRVPDNAGDLQAYVFDIIRRERKNKANRLQVSYLASASKEKPKKSNITKDKKRDQKPDHKLKSRPRDSELSREGGTMEKSYHAKRTVFQKVDEKKNRRISLQDSAFGKELSEMDDFLALEQKRKKRKLNPKGNGSKSELPP